MRPGRPHRAAGARAATAGRRPGQGHPWRLRQRGKVPCMRIVPDQPCLLMRARSRHRWRPGEQLPPTDAGRTLAPIRREPAGAPRPLLRPLRTRPWQVRQALRSGCKPRPGAGALSGLPCAELLPGSCRLQLHAEAGTRSPPPGSLCLVRQTRCERRSARLGAAAARPGPGSSASGHGQRLTSLRSCGCLPCPIGGRGSALLSVGSMGAPSWMRWRAPARLPGSRGACGDGSDPAAARN